MGFFDPQPDYIPCTQEHYSQLRFMKLVFESSDSIFVVRSAIVVFPCLLEEYLPFFSSYSLANKM